MCGPSGSWCGVVYARGKGRRRRRGREVRVSECQFNLIGVHPCRGAGDPCREATVICANCTPVRVEKTDRGKYMDVCVECR